MLEWADKLDVKVQFARCSAHEEQVGLLLDGGNLNFNAELLIMDRKPLETTSSFTSCCTFSCSNHGKLWKSLMRAHLGDYEKLDRKLKQCAKPSVSVSRIRGLRLDSHGPFDLKKPLPSPIPSLVTSTARDAIGLGEDFRFLDAGVF